MSKKLMGKRDHGLTGEETGRAKGEDRASPLWSLRFFVCKVDQ